MVNVKKNERIEYFDLMKGVCIVLVIIGHCFDYCSIVISNVHVWSMLEHLRMPLYFFLAGMFFKEYTGFLDFVIRKTNKLVIPFLFFCLISVIPLLISGVVGFNLSSIVGHFLWMVKYGGYLWFLRTLFCANIMFYIYYKFTHQKGIYLQILLLLLVVTIGWFCNALIPIENEFRINHPYVVSLLSAVIVLPFFYVASKLNRILPVLKRVSKIYILLIGILSCLLCYLTSNGGVYLMNGLVDNNIFLFYISSLSAITCCWSLCYMIKRMPYLSYIGRYSIIAYLTHYPLIKAACNMYPCINVYMLVVLVLLIMPLMIWFFKKYFPAFVAQKDIFIYENRRLKIDWTVFSLKKK